MSLLIAVVRVGPVDQVSKPGNLASAMPSTNPAGKADLLFVGVGACWRLLRGIGHKLATGRARNQYAAFKNIELEAITNAS